MVHTQADADLAAEHVKEARERIIGLTIKIMDAMELRQSTSEAEALLLEMFRTLELMLEHQREIDASLRAGN